MHIIEQLYKFIDKENVDDVKHYTDVLKYRGHIFFNEVYANFTYIENLEDNKEAGIKHFIEGMEPVETEPFCNEEIYTSYLDAVFSYFDELYYKITSFRSFFSSVKYPAVSIILS